MDDKAESQRSSAPKYTNVIKQAVERDPKPTFSQNFQQYLFYWDGPRPTVAFHGIPKRARDPFFLQVFGAQNKYNSSIFINPNIFVDLDGTITFNKDG